MPNLRRSTPRYSCRQCCTPSIASLSCRTCSYSLGGKSACLLSAAAAVAEIERSSWSISLRTSGIASRHCRMSGDRTASGCCPLLGRLATARWKPLSSVSSSFGEHLVKNSRDRPRSRSGSRGSSCARAPNSCDCSRTISSTASRRASISVGFASGRLSHSRSRRAPKAELVWSITPLPQARVSE